MKIEGKIKTIGSEETFGKNGFRVRKIVVVTNEQYPQPVEIQFVQDKCVILDNYQVGQDVEININIRSREYTSPQGEIKYFINLQGWRISKVGSAVDAYQQKAAQSNLHAGDEFLQNEEEEDTLPF